MNFSSFSRPSLTAFSPSLLEAEQAFAVSPALCVLSCRKALELCVKFVYAAERLETPYSEELNALMSDWAFKSLLPDGMIKRLDYIRRLGNIAAHTGKSVAHEEAVLALNNLFMFADWIDYSYSPEYEEKKFDEAALPQPDSSVARQAEAKLNEATASLEQMRKQNAELLEQIERMKQAPPRAPYEAEDISEFETRRRYIDLDLKEAGWALKDNYDIEVPVKGMPFGSGDGFVDYVLYGPNGKPLAVVEAKRTSKGPGVGQQQAKLYADCLEAATGQRPVIFYTNGFETWLWDDTFYPPRRVSGFYSPDDLKWLVDKRRERLSLEHIDIREDITNRYYQKEAIISVCEAYRTRRRMALLVMATGTGKTRTVISLADVLSRCGWVKNVLFLADRTALVRQAKKHFKQHLPNMSLCNLVERSKDETPDARVVFSTYQTIMNAIDNERCDNNARLFTVGHFDLIVVDEAHRSIYNKYAEIFNYFDALLCGLTATPRDEVDRDTYRIFDLETGVPTYAYELDQAIADKYLVPYHTVESTLKFMSQGIEYEALSEEEKQEYEEKFGDADTSDNLPPWIDANALNTWLFNEDTIDRVLLDLMQKGLRVEGGDNLGKTIIFARNHKHAEFIVERFNKLFPELGGHFARVVDNYTNYVQNLIDDFSTPERLPQIAVSVDMLDTGIDVLEVVNLVFFKKVFSKTKFWQMVGRGTRLCPNLFAPGAHKEHFLCFDYCGNFEFFRAQKDGRDNTAMASLAERALYLRVDIVAELQDLKWQEGDYPTCRSVFVQELVHDIQSLNRDSFLVKRHLAFVDRYSKPEAWQALTQVQSAELKDALGPIMPPSGDDEAARRFDVLMYRLEYKFLQGNSFVSEQKMLIAIAEALSKLGTIPQVKMQEHLILSVLEADFWSDVTLTALEMVRKGLRSLVQFLTGKERHHVYTDFTDVVLDVQVNEYTPRGTEFVNYRRKAEAYIRSNQDNIAIHKLKTNRPLTPDDFKVLENILWGEVGTREEYAKTFGDKPLNLLVREITGLDRTAANEAFSAFLSDHDLNQVQITFVRLVADYVVKNGVLELQRLQEEPFRSIGSITQFPIDKGKKLVDTIREINTNAGLV